MPVELVRTDLAGQVDVGPAVIVEVADAYAAAGESVNEEMFPRVLQVQGRFEAEPAVTGKEPLEQSVFASRCRRQGRRFDATGLVGPVFASPGPATRQTHHRGASEPPTDPTGPCASAADLYRIGSAVCHSVILLDLQWGEIHS